MARLPRPFPRHPPDPPRGYAGRRGNLRRRAGPGWSHGPPNWRPWTLSTGCLGQGTQEAVVLGWVADSHCAHCP